MMRTLNVIIIMTACLILPVQTQATVPSTEASNLASYPGEYRVALVIGNSTYAQAPLVSPVKDARAMTANLQELGFHVINLENASAAQMTVALREFGDTLRTVGGVGLFYYAGHGVQLEGENYLVPINTDVQRLHEIKYQSLNLNQVLDELGEAQNRLNIVILDACRNNPFTRNTRSFQNGLAPINHTNTPSGTFIAFATGPGQVAIDGDDNGLFTKHLLTNMTIPGLPIEQVFKRVRTGVMAETAGDQVPWENSSLTGDFYFMPNVNSKTNSTLDMPASLPAMQELITQVPVTQVPILLANRPVEAKAPPTKLIKLSSDQLQLGPLFTPAVSVDTSTEQLLARASRQTTSAVNAPNTTLDELLSEAQYQFESGQVIKAQRSLDEAFTHFQSANLDQLRIMTDLTQALTQRMLNPLKQTNRN